MPIYEYYCKTCGHIEEKFYKIAEKPHTTALQCDLCGQKREFEFCVSAPAVVYGVLSAAAKMPSEFKNRMDQIRKNNPNMSGKYY